MSKINLIKQIIGAFFILVLCNPFFYAADSRGYPVTATYCDGSTIDIYPFSFVTRTDGSTFNCYEVLATPIQNGYRYGFEDKDDADYNDTIIEIWVTGNGTSNPAAHVKFVSKEASYKHWIYLVYNGVQQLIFKAEDSSPGAVYDIPLPVKACGDFEIKPDPFHRAIDQGDSTHYTVTVKALDGFSDDVNLKVDGLPSGASGVFQPNPLPVTGEAKLDITTTPQVPVGMYTLTITGTAGDITRSAEVTLEIKGEPPEPDFSIEASPVKQEIFQGESTTYTVTLNALNGFDSSISLTVSGLPDGAGGVFGINSLTPAPTGESILNITTAADTPVGSCTLTIAAEGGGKNHSTQVTLKINEKPLEPDFSINASPLQRAIHQGDSTHYTVTVKALNGFSDDVNLKVEGLPSGASAAFQPNPLPITGEAKLDISTTAKVPVGIYTLTVTGTAGEIARTAQVTLEIKEALPEPDFEIKVEPLSRTINAGEAADYKVKLTALYGYVKIVVLSIDGLPEGATAAFQPDRLRGGEESELTITTTENTAVGEHKLTVIAERGTKKHKVEITLNIEEAPTPLEPDFEIKAEPGERTLHRGESTDYTVTLTAIDEFSEEVSLSVTGVPAGTGAAFGEAAVTPTGTTQLHITTSADTPVGPHTLTITAKGGGKEHSAVVKLMVICRDFSLQIKASTDRGGAPLAVKFEAEISRPDAEKIPVSEYRFRWDFGDGTTSDQQDPEHTFQAPGNYQVTLKAADTCGQAKTTSVTIEAEGFEGAISKSFSVSEAVPGDEVFITIDVKNETRLDITNVTVRDELSPLLEYLEDSAGAAPARSGQELEWRFPLLKKGETISFKIKVKVNENAPPGVINNTAFLYHDSLGPGKRITSNTASLTINQIDVTLAKQVEQTTAQPGDTIKYQLTIKNNSSVPLTGVKLIDELSHYLEFISASGNGSLKFGRQGRVLQWEGTLEPQEQVVIIFKARAGSNLFSGTRIENTAKLAAAELKEPLNSDTVVTTVTAEPVPTGKIRFTKRSEVPQTEIGKIVRFRLTVVNMSNSMLISPVIEDHLPQGFGYVAQSTLLNNQRFTEPQGTRRLLWQLPHIRSNETVVIRYQVVIGADAKRGKNVNRAVFRATDNSGQDLFFEASAFVNVSTSSIIFYSGVEGTVYLDRDGDDFYSITDTPLQGIEVRMSTGEKAITDVLGSYRFENLFPGEYAVGVNRATLPEKYQLSYPFPKVVVLMDGLTDTADFAVKFRGDDNVGTARLQGRVFYDKNRNRVFDGDDPLAQKFKARLDNKNITAGSNGTFVFTHLEPGPHTIEITYGPRTVKKAVTLKQGKNYIDIPLIFSGIKIIIKGEEQ